jgi:hypothetical protein
LLQVDSGIPTAAVPESGFCPGSYTSQTVSEPAQANQPLKVADREISQYILHDLNSAIKSVNSWKVLKEAKNAGNK